MRVSDLPACKPVSSKKNPLVLKYMARRVLFILLVPLAGFLFNGALPSTPRNFSQASRLGQSDTVCINVDAGWNLLSFPLRAPDGRTIILFPTAGSNAFSYQGHYVRVDTLQPGMGYWLKFGSAQAICFYDTAMTSDTIDVVKGWNLVGTISFPVDVSRIISNSPTMIRSPFYGYKHGYLIVTILEPGHGYWLFVNEDGKLILNSQGVKALK